MKKLINLINLINLFKLLLISSGLLGLSACGSDSAPSSQYQQPVVIIQKNNQNNTKSRIQQAQQECEYHYRTISDEFTRLGKIKSCMRGRLSN